VGSRETFGKNTQKESAGEAMKSWIVKTFKFENLLTSGIARPEVWNLDDIIDQFKMDDTERSE